MMGNKKLSTIRDELRQAIAATGDDPIDWLEKRISAAKLQGGDSSVLLALKHVLERDTQKKPSKRAGKPKTRPKKRQPAAG
jgi:hypothetical protein